MQNKLKVFNMVAGQLPEHALKTSRKINYHKAYAVNRKTGEKTEIDILESKLSMAARMEVKLMQQVGKNGKIKQKKLGEGTTYTAETVTMVNLKNMTHFPNPHDYGIELLEIVTWLMAVVTWIFGPKK